MSRMSTVRFLKVSLMSKERPEPTMSLRVMMDPTESERADYGAAFERLVGIMAYLRGPEGCPWDRKMTLEQLKPNLIEEAYEVLEAMDHGSLDDHREELGDLLLQVVYQAELRREVGAFDVAEVAHGVADKLVRRHPAVFPRAGAAGEPPAPSGPGSWEAIKRREKAGRSAIGGVPRSLPALLRAQRVTQKASRVGFDWPAIAGPIDKLEEELGELRAAVARGELAAVRHELGDLLFSMVNLARFLDADAEDALTGTVDRFEARFRHMEAQATADGFELDELSAEALENYWRMAKEAVG